MVDQSLQRAQVSLWETAIACLDWVAGMRKRGFELAPHLQTGIHGEEAALFQLRRRGCVIVAQRWNDGPTPGDLDVIAWDGDILCFVEVKARTSREIATASSAVDRNKRRVLRRLARHYLRHLPGGEDAETHPPTRFDIVTVYRVPGEREQVQLIPGAFGWREQDRDWG